MPADDDRLLPDDSARRRITADLDATLFVEAGAGTGKTTTLVARVVAHVRAGVPLARVAAITFTEAAAAELRERIRGELVTAAAGAPGEPLWRRALGELDEAAITTFHGFCQKILLEDPLRAGLPLRVRVLDEIEAELEFQDRFSAFLDALLEEPAAHSLLAAAFALGVTTEHLRDLAWRLEDPGALEPGAGLEDPGDLAATANDAWRSVCDALAGLPAFAAHCRDENDRLLWRVRELGGGLARLETRGTWLERLRAVARLTVPKVGATGRKANWTGCDIAEVRDAIEVARAARDGALGRLHDAVLRALVARLAAASRTGANERVARGELCFADLLARCGALLRDDADARRAVRERYRHVLVDEFQDTDELQLEILRLIGQAEVGGGLEAGRLFFVGDPKQAIYRFRGADVRLYTTARDALGPDASTKLVANFRSRPGVLSYVNALFGRLLADNPVGPGELIAVRPAHEWPAVHLLGGPLEAGRATERRREETALVADALARVVEEGWPIGDGDGTRPARYGDCAVLVTRRTGLAELEAGLEAAGVPYRLAASALVYASAEVHDLLSCLRALVRPGDERAVVSALRSAAFGCDDTALLEWRLGGGRFEVGAPAPAGLGGQQVARALGDLERLAELRYGRRVGDFVAALVEDRALNAVAAGLARHRDAWRRLASVQADADAFGEHGGDVAGFLQWAERQVRHRSTERLPAEPDDDAVQVLTVHAAKGLEFPVVVVAELGSHPRGPSGPTLLRGAAGTLEARIVAGLSTAGFAEAAEDDRAAGRAELLRLAYVAATRARDYLLLALVHRAAASPEGACLAEQIHEASRDLPGWRPLPRRGAVARGARPEGGAGDALEAERAFDQALAARRDLLSRRAGGRVVAPSSLSPALAGTAVPAPGTPGRAAATALGRAVHRVLERAEPGDTDVLDALAAAEAHAEGIAPAAAEVAALARAALSSPSVRAAAHADRIWRELPLLAAVGETLVDGTVDLCFEVGGEVVLVDYKTDTLESEKDVAAAAARYRLQVGAYALAFETVLGRPATRVVLVFLAAPGRAVEHVFAPLAPLAAEAARAIAAADRT